MQTHPHPSLLVHSNLDAPLLPPCAKENDLPGILLYFPTPVEIPFCTHGPLVGAVRRLRHLDGHYFVKGVHRTLGTGHLERTLRGLRRRDSNTVNTTLRMQDTYEQL